LPLLQLELEYLFFLFGLWKSVKCRRWSVSCVCEYESYKRPVRSPVISSGMPRECTSSTDLLQSLVLWDFCVSDKDSAKSEHQKRLNFSGGKTKLPRRSVIEWRIFGIFPWVYQIKFPRQNFKRESLRWWSHLRLPLPYSSCFRMWIYLKIKCKSTFGYGLHTGYSDWLKTLINYSVG
jgi:hypothetical protein